jgi:hypothetical protein
LSGDVLAPTATRDAMRSDDRAALTARAAPRVADPAQTIAAESWVWITDANRADYDVVAHRSHHPCAPVTRQCIACGVLRECDPGLPCGECGASAFHLIPLAPRSA